MPERRWEGGYIRQDKRGRDVYVIRRKVRGRAFKVSTRCHTARSALEHLARFEADPQHYDPRGRAPSDPIGLDKPLAESFLGWSRETKKNTRKWVGEQKAALKWWQGFLRGRDLRSLPLAGVIIPALDGSLDAPKKTPGRAHKIATLKALYAWLRRERHLLSSTEDPTVDLSVPQSRPAQRRMQKERTPEQVQLVVAELDPLRRRARLAEAREVELDQVRHMTDYRPHLRLAASTGWHVTELARFASAGRILDPAEMQAQDGTAAVLETMHKNGEVFRTRVGQVGAAAARALREAGGFSIERYAEAVKEAAEAAGVKGFRGALRHSALTWATDHAGVAEAASVARHKNQRTTKRFYAERGAPPNVLARLELVK
jgi:hypothetical protein